MLRLFMFEVPGELGVEETGLRKHSIACNLEPCGVLGLTVSQKPKQSFKTVFWKHELLKNKVASEK